MRKHFKSILNSENSTRAHFTKALAKLEIDQLPLTNQSNMAKFPSRQKISRMLLNNRVCYVTPDMLTSNPVDISNPNHFQILLLIMKKLPNQKFDEELEFMHLAFENIKFFSSIKQQMEFPKYLDLFRELTIEEFKSGQRIFSYGDIGRKFYIILKGSVYVLLRKQGLYPDGLTNEKKVESKLFLEPETMKKVILEFTPEMSEEERQNIVLDYLEEFFIGRTLGIGSSFGEIALQTTTGSRTATILCREDTTVGVLSWDAYDKFLSKLDQEQIEDTLKFFSNITLFNHWSDNEIRSFLMNVEKKVASNRNIIYDENDEPSHIYFIRTGEVEISTTQERIKDEEINPNENIFFKENKIKFTMRQALIGPEQFFGEYEILNNKPKRITKAICYTQECIYFAIHKDKFFNTIKDTKTLDILINHSKKKENWHNQLLESFHKIYINSSNQQLKRNFKSSWHATNSDAGILISEPTSPIPIDIKGPKRKMNGRILHSILSQKESPCPTNTVSSFSSLIYDPLGVAKQNENNKDSMVLTQFMVQPKNPKSLKSKSKYASFLSSKAINHMLEKKFATVNENFQKTGLIQEKELQLSNSKLSISKKNQVSPIQTSLHKTNQPENNLKIKEKKGKTRGLSLTNNLKFGLNQYSNKSKETINRISDIEILKLYKTLHLERISDILIKSPKHINYGCGDGSKFDYGNLYLTSYANYPTLSTPKNELNNNNILPTSAKLDFRISRSKLKQ